MVGMRIRAGRWRERLSGVVLTKRLDAKEALARAEVVRTKLEDLLADQVGSREGRGGWLIASVLLRRKGAVVTRRNSLLTRPSRFPR